MVTLVKVEMEEHTRKFGVTSAGLHNIDIGWCDDKIIYYYYHSLENSTFL